MVSLAPLSRYVETELLDACLQLDNLANDATQATHSCFLESVIRAAGVIGNSLQHNLSTTI
jgi:hypothetical protein